MTEHSNNEDGIVEEYGDYTRDNPNHRKMSDIAARVGEHGEVHAVFQGVEDEVELRLGTLRVNYEREAFEVWDGDHYQVFPADGLRYAYKPMEVFH